MGRPLHFGPVSFPDQQPTQLIACRRVGRPVSWPLPIHANWRRGPIQLIIRTVMLSLTGGPALPDRSFPHVALLRGTRITGVDSGGVIAAAR
jgi:hypothetical protein